MKLKVTPEGRPGCYLIGVMDLANWLDDWFKTREYMHNYIANDGSRMVVGADWKRDNFDVHLAGDVTWAVVVGRQDGLFAGHRLICVDMNNKSRPMRYVFDVGEITEADLEVIGEAEEMANKIDESDRGQLGAMVTIKNGKIIIDFGKELSWIALDRPTAESMIKLLQEKVAKL